MRLNLHGDSIYDHVRLAMVTMPHPYVQSKGNSVRRIPAHGMCRIPIDRRS
ncbi:MAG: hypothetical protein ACLUOF_09070 [Ruminococcus sp.]